MEDNGGDVLGIVYELVHFVQKLFRGDVTRSLDISAYPVVIAYVDDEVVFNCEIRALGQ